MAKKKKGKKLFDDLGPEDDTITRAPEKIKRKKIKEDKNSDLFKNLGPKDEPITRAPEKIKKRQAGGALKPIDPETQPGLAALKKESPETVNKMGYAKKGGRIVSAMTGGQIVAMMYDD